MTRYPGDRGGNVSTIAALGLDGIRTGLSVPGTIDTQTMLFFVEEMLAPTLKRGDLVFLDNCSIHKAEEIAEAIEARGAWVIFLPTYSPDLNPIENCWSKVKSILRSLKPRSLQNYLLPWSKLLPPSPCKTFCIGLITAAIGPQAPENRYNLTDFLS